MQGSKDRGHNPAGKGKEMGAFIGSILIIVLIIGGFIITAGCIETSIVAALIGLAMMGLGAFIMYIVENIE